MDFSERYSVVARSNGSSRSKTQEIRLQNILVNSVECVHKYMSKLYSAFVMCFEALVERQEAPGFSVLRHRAAMQMLNFATKIVQLRRFDDNA